MVSEKSLTLRLPNTLSVLALSSRFDGLEASPRSRAEFETFSTRSVESF